MGLRKNNLAHSLDFVFQTHPALIIRHLKPTVLEALTLAKKGFFSRIVVVGDIISIVCLLQKSVGIFKVHLLYRMYEKLELIWNGPYGEVQTS